MAPSDILTTFEADIEALVGNNAVLVRVICNVVEPLGTVITGLGLSVSTRIPGSLTCIGIVNRLFCSDDSSTWSLGSISMEI